VTVMPITDAMFLLAEARERPMHVGGLQLFRPPEGADRTYVGEVYRQAIAHGEVHPRLRRRPVRNLVGAWGWEDDPNLDLEYHVRHSALPHPGRVRELLALTSRLHGTLLDRHRPLWEAHVIEGLHDDRFALYTKIHHALVDGVSAMRMLERALSEDPDERGMAPPFAARSGGTPREEAGDHSSSRAAPVAASVTEVATGAVAAVRGVIGAGDAALRSVVASFREQAAALPFKAPRSMFNVTISGARRFAADDWPLDRIRAVGKALDGTVNDVVLAMSAGALRRYLVDHDALPDQPLVAMVPVSLRLNGGGDGDEAGGNAVGLILTNLGTHLDDPVDRFGVITASTEIGKLRLSGLNQEGVLLLSALSFAPLALGPLYRFEMLRRPPFNVIISNVPGPPRPLYWNGAQLDGMYPLSIPVDGQALNITVSSYAGRLGFGLTGCRRSVPQLQRMLTHLETSLAELETAAGV
jgi:diacylglycerol O-acyltransferase / wax synthase